MEPLEKLNNDMKQIYLATKEKFDELDSRINRIEKALLYIEQKILLFDLKNKKHQSQIRHLSSNDSQQTLFPPSFRPSL